MISDSGGQLISLLFNKDEEICVSHDEFGYKSIPIASLRLETVNLTLPNPAARSKTIKTSDLKLVAINPIKGFRRDENVTAFRNFLVELDDGTIEEQLTYAWAMGLPYSAFVFSGNKSLHFAVSLEETLPSYEIYYFYATWILSVMSRADGATKNPSRSIRLAGAVRNGREQKLGQIRPRIRLGTLDAWLSKYPHLKPQMARTREREDSDTNSIDGIDRLPGWLRSKLVMGIDKTKGRNLEWFKIASEFGKIGLSEDQVVAVLEDYFVPEYDFKKSEWSITVKSGARNGNRKRGSK